jgi:hypothetical protein
MGRAWPHRREAANVAWTANFANELPPIQQLPDAKQ